MMPAEAATLRPTETKAMKKAPAITCVFLDIGGVLLTDGWACSTPTRGGIALTPRAGRRFNPAPAPSAARDRCRAALVTIGGAIPGRVPQVRFGRSR